ncbi:MAG: ATP-binding cassette domain-containing protein [Erysipelotrichaceae bacterium]|nr:ATP-binding cassette domain-containing protein [Erysipelotrichaceae bacterium]
MKKDVSGPAGSRLSGGEQQRLAIARALLKDPQYLILDEATANLDVKTEAQVVEGLKELMKGRTVIVIAHDYLAVKDADQFIIMKDGIIEKAGTKGEVKDNDYFRQFMKADI